MLTYQVRERVFRFDVDNAIAFPARIRVTFVFGPEQPFGESPGGGRTAVRAVAATVLFNANTGHHEVTSKKPLDPLSLRIEEPDRVIECKGRELSVTQEFSSLAALGQFVSSVAFAFPWLLSVPFADPVHLERVHGEIDGRPFRWELRQWQAETWTTTQEEQESAVADAWRRLSLLSDVKRRRLLGGLHYYHVAMRLKRAGLTAGEFMSEVLLNLCKVLECLVPPGSRDAARAGLAQLGYPEDVVERDFVPVMLLRNEMGVGHVQLSAFRQEHLSILHRFLEGVEPTFDDLLKRVLTKIEAGEWDVPAYDNLEPDRDLVGLIETIGGRLANGST